MKAIMLAAGAALALAATVPAVSADTRAVAVLNTEQRWLQAIDTRDAKALAQILAPNFVHVDYRGAVQNRDGALAAIKQPKPFAQRLGDETVTVQGNVAIVHGVNTITQGERTVLRLRFTDVFVYESGAWKAISAQETQIATMAHPSGT